MSDPSGANVRVTEETNDRLVLTDVAGPIRMLGLACLLPAIGLYQALGTASGRMDLLLSLEGALLLAALALLLLPTRVIAVFDRPSRTLTIRRRSLFANTIDQVDFKNIAKVTTDYMETRTRSGHQGHWRVVIVLRDRTRIPLTKLYSSNPLHVLSARAAQHFLALATGEPDDAGDAAAVDPRARRRDRIASRKAIAVYAGILGIGALITGVYVTTYLHAYLAAQPIRVRILSSALRSYQSKNGMNFEPAMRYAYEVDGETRVGRRVWLNRSTASRAWVAAFVTRHPADSEMMGWYDTWRVQGAFLIRDWSILPLVLFAVAMYFAGYFIWTWRAMAPRDALAT